MAIGSITNDLDKNDDFDVALTRQNDVTAWHHQTLK